MSNEQERQTEQRNPCTTHMDRLPVRELLQVMNRENYRVAEAVDEAISQIVPLVEELAKRLPQGGRLIYVGAGTSGRLAMLDAAECPPTFGVSPQTVVALIAGGPAALVKADAGQEDNEAQGRTDLAALVPTELDTVLGISAAGGAAYVLGAMRQAREAGALVASLCCNPNTPMEQLAQLPICVLTGAEAVTGSTRLKAGSAQKMVLNLISTGVMVRLGKVYENFMVGVQPTNEKLLLRAVSMVRQITGCTEAEARQALGQAEDVRCAVLWLKKQKGGECL